MSNLTMSYVDDQCPNCGCDESKFIEQRVFDDFIQKWVVESAWYECPSCCERWGMESRPTLEEMDFASDDDDLIPSWG